MLATTTLATRSRYLSRPGLRFAAAAACAALLLASTTTARAATLSIGNIYTFSTGSTPSGTDPAGTWTLGDKSFTYLSQSGFGSPNPDPAGLEEITITDFGTNHSFLLADLASYSSVSGTTLVLGYRLDIVPSSPYVLNDVDLDSNVLSANATVTKDVYSTLGLFNAAGTGDLAQLVSINGNPVTPVSLLGLTQVWVRDTIVLDANGAVSGLGNNFSQVPEIDATSLAGAFPLLVGGLALLERRRRKPTGDAALSGS